MSSFRLIFYFESKSRPSIFGPFKRTQFATQPDKYNQLYYFAIIIRALFSVIVKTPKIEPWEWKNPQPARGAAGRSRRNLGRQLMMTGIPVRFTFSG